MRSTQLIHIAPELPPTVGGVADYTALLSRRLVEVSDGAVEPVLVHAGRQHADAIEVDFRVVDLSGQCSGAELAQTIDKMESEAKEGVIVLLEYSGYGYARNGAPRWLVNGLRRACGKGGCPLITVFHELYASEYRPWKRNFWTLPLQHYVSSRLARLSARMTANSRDVYRWLRHRVDECRVQVSPSFSNVGEPAAVPGYDRREPYAICFGGAQRKDEMYREHSNDLERLLGDHRIEEVVDIGPKVSENTISSFAVPVVRKGVLSKQRVSTFLRNGSLGLLNYGLHCVEKSGVWASYASHGLPTVLTSQRHSRQKLSEGRHFLLPDTAVNLPGREKLAQISDAARRWYFEVAHSKRAAHRIMGYLKDVLDQAK